jgi:hypothetical protein
LSPGNTVANDTGSNPATNSVVNQISDPENNTISDPGPLPCGGAKGGELRGCIQPPPDLPGPIQPNPPVTANSVQTPNPK